MFNFNSDHTLAGPGYITLNVIRVLNIISLLTVVVASWIMLVMTVKTSNFFFFDGVSHFITSTIGIFLIVSECTLFPKYFARNWPMLSPSSGFVFLGLAMIILGFNILGNLNKTATSIENLGLPLWREVIASGILSSIMGLFNIIATFVFCDSAQGITGRRVRSHGAIAPKDEEHASTGKTFSLTSSQSTRSQRSQRSQRPLTPVLPSYHPNETTSPSDRHKSRFGLKFPIRMSGMHISKPIIDTNTSANNSPPRWQSRNSPVVENLQRPPTALHPAFDPVRAPSSRYSEVSHLQRFSRGDLI